MPTVIDAVDIDDLVAQAAARFSEVISRITASPIGGVSKDGYARIVLTGGGAGIKLLETLAVEAADLHWDKVHIFFGDERNVPVSDPESNEGQSRAALLSKVSIPAENIHGYGLSFTDLETAAINYERVLNRFAPQGFDVHLLGMGGEGHINSLFPHSKATKEKDRKVLAVVDSPKPPAQRITLTLPAIQSAHSVWLLVSGSEKMEAAAAIRRGADYLDWPAAGAKGQSETLLFLSADAKK